LLILAGEVVLADRAADSLKGGERLTLGMQGLSLAARKALWSPDGLDLELLVGFAGRVGGVGRSRT
jgi:hypothetical protein